MVFNVDKCHFAGKHIAVTFNYKLDGKILTTTTSCKYLGVQITDFSWDLHVNSITLTASQGLGMIERVLFDAPKKTKKLLMLHSADPF